jgi:8-oxo-dGTP diphosphatase
MTYREKKYCPFCGGNLFDYIEVDRLRKKCGSCDTIMYENPIPATALIVVNPQNANEIALVKRAVEPCKGEFSLPGGFLELDETPEQGAIRELHEETGLEGRVKKLLGIKNQYSPQYISVLLLCFEMEILSGIIVGGDDSDFAAYFPLDDHPPIAFDTHRYFVENYIAQLKGNNDKS